MSQKEKLVKRFLSLTTDFHYDELIKLLGYFDFKEIKTGKTSGSRVRFVNSDGKNIIMHRPHQQA